ncbi:DUF2637 domain-containing protein [Streptomyces sp. DSM 3412]|uniref:DUF2637 domain-containing protein n=1 Tax=Streptomyces gottesmaniae TaxID=3075518 RepID=A0ABU2YU97_9ACTN|nr:DUF2637 domain-containing protein [Streptomyces sp. DSM 3412]MDT0567895.1 DUF2637 domain-containing protein [Streptomyces sp. DSM 3412]
MAELHPSAPTPAQTTPTPTRRLGGSVRVAWFIVLVMMLAAAAWSISAKLTAWGMDQELALGLSLMFDLAGLLCAQYARRAIERGTPAGLARLAVFAFVTVSGLLNWSHGKVVGGTVAGVGLASISFAVELLFELHRRDVRDEQRAARGLIAERMPHIPLLAWVMFPAQAWRTLRSAVRTRLATLDSVAAPVTTVTSVDRVVEQPVTPPVTPPDPPKAHLPVAPALPAAPVKRQPVVPAGTQLLPIVTPPVAQASAATPQPSAPSQYNDPRCSVIRPLYDAGTRPGTKAMRTAIISAGYPDLSDGFIRGTLRAEIEKHEPHLAALPPAPVAFTA